MRVRRILVWLAGILVVLFGVAWVGVAAFAADSSEGVPCGGRTVAVVQLVAAVVGLCVSGVTAATIVGVAREGRTGYWLRRELPLLVGLFALWVAVNWVGCANAA